MNHWAISKTFVSVVVSCTLLTLATAPAFSQEMVGSIVGKVADEQGLVMPGVVIAVSSPNLIAGSQTATTGDDGTYRVRNLPPGTYTIRVFAWDGQAWRHIGWYEDDGFTTIDYRATKIELDGADVTGIEIRLRLDPADMPTIE